MEEEDRWLDDHALVVDHAARTLSAVVETFGRLQRNVRSLGYGPDIDETLSTLGSMHLWFRNTCEELEAARDDLRKPLRGKQRFMKAQERLFGKHARVLEHAARTIELVVGTFGPLREAIRRLGGGREIDEILSTLGSQQGSLDNVRDELKAARDDLR